MNVLLYIGFALIGLIIGSFLNVVIFRLPKNISITGPFSFCPHCRTKIKAYDNIPLLSFIFLRGRCRYCKARISARYPIVEAVTAILFVLNYHYFKISLACLSGILFCMALIVVSFIDMEIRLIPNIIVLSGALIGLLLTIIRNPFKWWVPLAYSAGAFLFMFIINLVFPKGMGMGDVKLSMMAGAFLAEKVIPGLFLGFLIGSVAGIILIILKKRTFKQSIAFGPFISSGCIAALFYGDKIINWYLRFI